MTLTGIAAALACGIFAAAMLHALVTDLRHRRIRNTTVIVLLAAWLPMAIAAGVPATEMAAAVVAAVMVFAAGFGCFAAGWIGGGDVKLAAAAALWLGAGQAASFLLLASVLGAVLTVLIMVAVRIRRGAVGHGRPRIDAGSRAVPYGPALAGAALALLHASPIAAAL